MNEGKGPTLAAASSPGQAAEPRPWGAREFAGHFIFCVVLFGLVFGAVFSSGFPFALGLFLFLTDDRFIAWVLGKVGIWLVPDTFGEEFVRAVVFLVGVSVLLAYWRDSAPKWLIGWLPPGAPASWALIGGGAALAAVLKVVSVAIVRKLLPWVGIAISPRRQADATLGALTVLFGLVVLVIAVVAPDSF